RHRFHGDGAHPERGQAGHQLAARNPVVQILLDQILHRSVLPRQRCRNYSFLSSPRRRGPIITNVIVVVSSATSLCCGVWVPAFAGTTEYHPPRTHESRPVVAEPISSSDRARRDVHGEGKQRGVEDER